MALRYLVPALAVIGQAAASCSGTTTISNSADAMALSTCLTYSGSIALATSTTDDIALDGVRRITGSFTAKHLHHMASLSGDSLQRVDDSFILNDIQILTSLNFPELTDVKTVEFLGIPNLNGLSFTAKLSEVENLSIQNTGLSSLEGIDLMQVDSMIVANNLYLNDISMQITHVSHYLSLQANGRRVNADFPNMKWANRMTFRNCSSVSIPSLASMNNSLGFYSNYFSSVATPNLTIAGGGVAFVSNAHLTNVSMPELKVVDGGILIANNTNLKTIDGFPRLSQVGGAIDVNGNFKSIDFPSLKDVRGAFNLQSEQNIDPACHHFRPLSVGRANVIKGPYTCAGGLNHPHGTGTLKPGTNAGNGGAAAASSSGAANPLYISGATGVMGIVAAIFGLL